MVNLSETMKKKKTGYYSPAAPQANKQVQTTTEPTSSGAASTPTSAAVSTPTSAFEASKDYSKSLNQGMENGAPIEALKPDWQKREAKIDADPNLSDYKYDKTYKNWQKYSGADTDIASSIKKAISSGASASEVQKLLDERDYKIAQNPNLSEYAYDDIYQAAKNYVNSKNKPYESKWDAAAERLLKGIDKSEFEYDFSSDPLYLQYLKSAREKGKAAMEDTMASIAQGAGGMNSYAASAAQGAYNNYLQGVDDVIPELYQLAYSKYQKDLDRKQNMLDTYLNLDNRDYGRYESERAYEDGRSDLDYERDVARYDRDYQEQQNERSWDYQLEKDKKEEAAADKQEAMELALTAVQSGFMPSEDIIARSGLDKEYLQGLLNAYLLNFSLSAKGGGSSGGGKSDYGDYDDYGEDYYGDYGEDDETKNSPYPILSTGSKIKAIKGQDDDAIKVTIGKMGHTYYTSEELKKALSNGEVKIDYDEDTGEVSYKRK